MSSINAGVLQVEYATVDLTGGIENAGNHPWDPAANTSIKDPEVAIVGQTDAGVHITWDHGNDRFLVTYADYDASGDGKLTDFPADGTSAGEVRVRVEGRR